MHLLVPVMHLCPFTDSSLSVIIEHPPPPTQGLEPLPGAGPSTLPEHTSAELLSQSGPDSPVPTVSSSSHGTGNAPSGHFTVGSKVNGLHGRSADSQLEVLTEREHQSPIKKNMTLLISPSGPSLYLCAHFLCVCVCAVIIIDLQSA